MIHILPADAKYDGAEDMLRKSSGKQMLPQAYIGLGDGSLWYGLVNHVGCLATPSSFWLHSTL